MNNTKTLRHLPALLFFSAILALPAQATKPKPGWYIAYHKANINNISSKLKKAPRTINIPPTHSNLIWFEEPIEDTLSTNYKYLKKKIYYSTSYRRYRRYSR